MLFNGRTVKFELGLGLRRSIGIFKKWATKKLRNGRTIDPRKLSHVTFGLIVTFRLFAGHEPKNVTKLPGLGKHWSRKKGETVSTVRVLLETK